MEDLRLEFANFKRDTMLNLDDDGKFIIENGTLPAIKGNLLEAVNLGLTSLNNRFQNTDLKHSISHIMVITLVQDYLMLNMTYYWKQVKNV